MRLLNFIKRNYNSKLNTSEIKDSYSKYIIIDGLVSAFALTCTMGYLLFNTDIPTIPNKPVTDNIIYNELNNK